MNKKMYLSDKDKKLFGVCGGIAEYLHIDSTLVRLIFIFLIFTFGTGFLVYLIAWIIMPKHPRKEI